MSLVTVKDLANQQDNYNQSTGIIKVSDVIDEPAIKPISKKRAMPSEAKKPHTPQNKGKTPQKGYQNPVAKTAAEIVDTVLNRPGYAFRNAIIQEAKDTAQYGSDYQWTLPGIKSSGAAFLEGLQGNARPTGADLLAATGGGQSTLKSLGLDLVTNPTNFIGGAAGVAKDAGLAAKILAGGKVGAGFSAASAFGEQLPVKDVVLSGAAGAALGGAIPAVGSAAGKVVGKVLGKGAKRVQVPALEPARAVKEPAPILEGETPIAIRDGKPVYAAAEAKPPAAKKPLYKSGSGEMQVSQFKTNTLTNAEFLQNPEVQKVIQDVPMMYEVKPNQQSIERATDMVSKDFYGTMQRLTGEGIQSAEDAVASGVITNSLRKEAQDTGDYSILTAWIKTVQPQVTNIAQSLQALSTWKNMTVEGALTKAAQVVNATRREVEKTNPNLVNVVDDMGKEIEQTVNTINKKTVEDVLRVIDPKKPQGSKLTKGIITDSSGKQYSINDLAQIGAQKIASKSVPEEKYIGDREPTLWRLEENELQNQWADEMIAEFGESIRPYLNIVFNEAQKVIQKGAKFSQFNPASESLANRIKSSLEPTVNPNDPIKQMVNVLFQVAKEQLPKQAKKPPKNQMDVITQALQMRDAYRGVWENSKGMLETKFVDNPEALDLLEKFFTAQLDTPYTEKQLDKAVRSAANTADIDFDDLVRQHYSVVDIRGKSLAQKIADQYDLPLAESSRIAGEIERKFAEIAGTKKEQILRQLFSKRGKAVQKDTIQRIIEYSNLGAFDNELYRGIVGEKLGIPNLSSEDVKFITDQMTKVEQMPDGYKKEVEFAKVKQLIADKVPATVPEQVKAAMNTMMLLNPKTLLTRNPGSNALLAVTENLKDIPGAAIDAVTSAVLGTERTTLAPSISGAAAQARGFGKGLTEWGKDIYHGVDTNPTRGATELPMKRIYKNDVANAVHDTMTRTLQLGDRPFWQAAYNGRLNELIKIKGVTEPTDEMAVDAAAYALERVLQNDSELVKGAGDIRRGINRMSGGIGGEVVMPFIQAPGNALDKVIDYSPGGLIRGALELTKVKKGTFNQKTFVDKVARGLTGTGLGLLGWDLASDGIITGSPNNDKDVASLEKSTGKLPWAINVDALIRKFNGGDPTTKKGDSYQSFNWANPIAVPMIVGADMFTAARDRKSTQSAFEAGLIGGGDAFFKQSFLQNLTKMLSGYSPTAGIVDVAMNAPLMFAPASGRQAAQLVDPIARETTSPDATTELLNQVKARTPGMSDTLPPRRDIWGKELPNYQGGNTVWNVLFNPGFSANYNPTPEAQFVLDVVNATGEKKVVPRTAEKSIPITVLRDGKKVKESIELTGNEISELQRIMGEYTQEKYSRINKDFVQRALDSPNSAAERNLIKRMNEILTDASQKGKAEILKQRGYLARNMGKGKVYVK